MRWWNNPKIVSKTPIVTVFCLEYANAGQLWRMWTEHTAAGQSLWSWMSVGLALLLWANFYRVICPQEKFALWATVFGIGMNAAVILSVVYWRYLAGFGTQLISG